jgi:WD40 repeat protein
MKRWQIIFLILWTLIGMSAAQEEWLPELDPLSSTHDASLPRPLVRLGNGIPYNITWLPDGKTIAVGSSIGVWFYDTTDFTIAPRLISTIPDSAYTIAFNADGSLMATGGSNVRLWDVKTGQLLEIMETIVRYLSFSPDNRLLAVTNGWMSRGGIELWDVQTGHFIKEMKIGRGLEGAVFTPDSQHLIAAIVSQWDAPETILWNVETDTETPLLENMVGVAFSPDGHEMIQIDRDGYFEIMPSSVSGQLPPAEIEYSLLFTFWTDTNGFGVYRKNNLYWIDGSSIEMLETALTG